MYHHFASKEELFRAAYEAVETDLCAATARAALASRDPVEQLRLGAREFLTAAAMPEVRRIVLLDAPSVLDVATRRALREQYGLGLVREALRAIDAQGRLTVQPVDALAIVLLAAMHEAATEIADGAPREQMVAVVDSLIDAVTREVGQ
jgi:AcrR family transcriptional regulator